MSKSIKTSLHVPSWFSSPVSVVANLCCGVGGGDEQVDHARLQLLQTHLQNRKREYQWHVTRPVNSWLLTNNFNKQVQFVYLTGQSVPDTSLWWYHQRPPLRHQPPLPPAWPSRPSRAVGGPRRSASQPDERSVQRSVYTSALCTESRGKRKRS